MQRTNYYLFDWLDFDRELKRDESLWKAYTSVDIKEEDGDIIISIPYQKQVLQEDMLADTSVPQRVVPFRLRAYGDKIVRVFTSMVGDEITETSYMLDIDKKLVRTKLSFSFTDNLVLRN